MGQLKYLVLHCTDTPMGRQVSAGEIIAWHTGPKPRGRGWRQVGYSDIIHLSGKVTNLVPYDQDNEVETWEITNGVLGINDIARHAVIVGGKDLDRLHMDTRTGAQRLTTANYVRQTIAQHPDIKVAGHYQFNKRKPYCPGWDVPMWLRAIGIAEKNIYQPGL